jgi:putative addiction module component (TIGR02574 family)
MAAIVSELKKLPISERIQLVEDIWDSIAEESPDLLQLTEPERVELNDRYAAHQDDPSTSIHWDHVRAKLFQGRG